MSKEKYFKAFFGVEPNSIRSKVIISPIIYPQQFEKLIGRKGQSYKSILSYLVVNFNDLTFIKTPMTQAAVADLVALSPQTKCREVFFVGAVAALQKEAQIGDVFISSRAKDFFSVKSMHDETQRKLAELRKKGVVGIDFESRPFFREAKKANLSAVACFVATDLPFSKPFYLSKTVEEKLLIQSSIAYIINAIK